MKRIINNARKTFIKKFIYYYDKHPYIVTFCFSSIVLMYIVFRVPYLEAVNNQMPMTHNFSFVDIQEVKLPKRKTKKEITTEETDNTEPSEDVDRATGLSDDPDAVDIAMFSNIVPPRLIGTLKNKHPKEARKKNIEATTYIELLIDSTGKVINVNILAIRLNKQLPENLHQRISASFAKAVHEMFKDRRYSITLINGEAKPIKLNQKINFKIE